MAGPRVTFLGGVNEIGGNKILVEDHDDRILFDFGPSFAPRYDEFYSNFLIPRSTSPVGDLLEFDLLPRVEGLYSEPSLAGSDLKYTSPELHGLFVSHAHMDHAGYLKFIDPKIPVFVGEGTKRLLDAIEETTAQKYGDHDWRLVPDAKPVRVGGIEVVPFPVDHSIPSAYGFLVHTSEGAIAYTGDFRMHGPRAPATHDFLAAAGAEKPRALIIEGTRAGPDPRPNLTEQGVRDGVDRILEKAPDLAVASCYPRDVDRITTLYRAARDSGRDFVISLKTAALLDGIRADLPDGAPVPGGDGVRVYLRPKKRYYNWEKPYLDGAVDAAFVRSHGRDLLLSLDLVHFAELIDLRPPRGTPFIHSMSEPFSEDDVDDKVLHNWLDHFGLAFHQMHASGHCAEGELHHAARTVQPNAVIPVHTEHPAALRAPNGPKVLPPKLGTPIALPR